MGKLKQLRIEIEEICDDIAVDLAYQIQDAIEHEMDTHREYMHDRVYDLCNEYELDLEDLEEIGLELNQIMDEAIENNRDW